MGKLGKAEKKLIYFVNSNLSLLICLINLLLPTCHLRSGFHFDSRIFSRTLFRFCSGWKCVRIESELEIYWQMKMFFFIFFRCSARHWAAERSLCIRLRHSLVGRKTTLCSLPWKTHMNKRVKEFYLRERGRESHVESTSSISFKHWWMCLKACADWLIQISMYFIRLAVKKRGKKPSK